MRPVCGVWVELEGWLFCLVSGKFGPAERRSGPPWVSAPLGAESKPSSRQCTCQQAPAAAQIVGHRRQPDLQAGFGEPQPAHPPQAVAALDRAEGAQRPPDCRLVDCDPELLKEPARQVLASPAHHAMDGRDRTALHHSGQSLALLLVQLGAVARRLAVDEPVGTMLVEAQHPTVRTKGALSPTTAKLMVFKLVM